MSIKPEDILADHENFVEFAGVKVRKGSMGASLANAELLAAGKLNATDKAAALQIMTELAPGLIAAGFNRQVRWLNPDIQAIYDKLEAEMNLS